MRGGSTRLYCCWLCFTLYHCGFPGAPEYNHKHRLLCALRLQGLLSWKADGSLLASASQKGTVVRVHAMPSAATVHCLR